MRCSSCNKFVSNGELEVEVENYEASGTTAVVEVRLVIPCGECSTELAESYHSLELELEGCICREGEDQLIEIEEPEVSPMEDFRPKISKSGKPVPFRFQKHFYGADIAVEGICGGCKSKVHGSGSVEEQSSSFEQLG